LPLESSALGDVLENLEPCTIPLFESRFETSYSKPVFETPFESPV
jgi:hypothetical protein